MVFHPRPSGLPGRAGTTFAVVLLAGAMLAILGGCSPAQEADPALPDGVSVEVYQSRSDYTSRLLEVSVTNGTDRLLTITGLTFTSDQFTRPAVWAKESTTIEAGVTANLPVPLPEANCRATKPTPRVEIRYRLAGKSRQVGFATPDDALGQLAPLLAADCFGEAVAARATISADTAPRVGIVDGIPVAQLDVRLEPTEFAGSMVVESARGTTLLAMYTPLARVPNPGQELHTTVASPGRTIVVTLALVPNRCDPHAVAEDKIGTVFPFTITLDDGTSGVVRVASATAVRAALYAFVEESCGGVAQ